MKISEMSLEDLQVYAVDLESKLAAKDQREQELVNEVNEFTELNKTLQIRNNELLLKIDQQPAGGDPTPEPPKNIESCEDFARKLIKGD